VVIRLAAAQGPPFSCRASALRYPTQINRDLHAAGGNTNVEMKAVTNLRSSHTGSQQVDTIDTDTTTPVIKVDFAEPGMRIPIHQVSRHA
jgi:hypothetical protein